MNKCEKCNTRIKTAYIRIVLENGKNTWKVIGYYCSKCKKIRYIENKIGVD